MSAKEYWRRVITNLTAVGLVIMILMLFALPVYGDTWVCYFPVGITDTSGAARTNVPILLGISGSALNSVGYINSSGTDTECQVGSSNISYMMGSTQIGVVIPSLPAYATVTTNLYTGYSPVETAFPIVLGNNGYFTTVASANEDITNSGNYTWTGLFNPASTGYLVNNPNAMTVQGNGSGNVTFTAGVTFPVIASSSNGTGSSVANMTVTLPASYVANDLVIISLNHYYAPTARTVTPPAGWTTISDNLDGGIRTGFYYKVMAGTEGTTVNFIASGNVVTYAYVANRIQTGTYIGVPVSGSAAIGATSSLPDPPSLTSGFGVKNTLWLACVGSTDTETTYSTGFTLTGGAATGTSCAYVSYKNEAVATKDPDAWSTNTYWIANTIAILGFPLSVTSNVISAAIHTICCYVNGSVIGIKVDSGAAITTAFTASIPASSSNLTWMSSNIFAYCSSISVSKAGVQKVLFQPTVMITSTTLPDAGGGGCTGTITFGTNTGVTVSYGAVASYSATSSNASSASGNFSPPTLELTGGSGWYATGNVSTQQPWSFFTSMSTAAGMDGKTILMFLAIGVAMIMGMLVFKSSGSVLIATIILSGCLYFFSEMAILPFALVFVFLIVSCAIMYLVRLM